MTSTLLRIEDVWTHYGLVPVLSGISLEVHAGEIVTLLGRNGAGKTTLLKNILGLYPISAGRIIWDKSVDLTRWPTHRIAALGIAYVPQAEKLFPDLTVLENLEIAMDGKIGVNAFSDLYNSIQRLLGNPHSLLLAMTKTLVQQRARQKAGTLSGGEQQVLSIVRTLSSEPRLLFLDEPLANLQRSFYSEMAKLLQSLKAQGVGILMVEQRVRWALENSDRTYVLQRGEVVFHGRSSELVNDVQALLTYLGIKSDARKSLHRGRTVSEGG